MLIVLPPELSAINAARDESGIERSTAIVARAFPKKSKIITAVRKSPIDAFGDEIFYGDTHELRLIEDDVRF